MATPERPASYWARCSATSASTRSRSGSRPTGPARSRSSSPGADLRGGRAPLRARGHRRPRPGAEYEYQVALDGAVRWPEPESEFPPSVLRTLDPGRPLRLAFGSCRIAELPVLRRRQLPSSAGGRGGARAGRAGRLRPGPARDAARAVARPDAADRRPGLRRRPGPATRKFIEQRRDPSEPPGYQVADFGEYCFLYREAWSEPSVRWLLSVVPTAMIFDDHDVHDDWNTWPPGAATTRPSRGGRPGSGPPT